MRIHFNEYSIKETMAGIGMVALVELPVSPILRSAGGTFADYSHATCKRLELEALGHEFARCAQPTMPHSPRVTPLKAVKLMAGKGRDSCTTAAPMAREDGKDSRVTNIFHLPLPFIEMRRHRCQLCGNVKGEPPSCHSFSDRTVLYTNAEAANEQEI